MNESRLDRTNRGSKKRGRERERQRTVDEQEKKELKGKERQKKKNGSAGTTIYAFYRGEKAELATRRTCMQLVV